MPSKDEASDQLKSTEKFIFEVDSKRGEFVSELHQLPIRNLIYIFLEAAEKAHAKS